MLKAWRQWFSRSASAAASTSVGSFCAAAASHTATAAARAAEEPSHRQNASLGRLDPQTLQTRARVAAGL